MKKLIMALMIFFIANQAKAQKSSPLSLQQQKDSASHYYNLIMHDLGDTSLKNFDCLLDKYNIYRTAVLSRLKTEKEKEQFLEWIVTEFREEQNKLSQASIK